MISKEEYALRRVKNIVRIYEKEKNENINPALLRNLIAQWEFDYEMEKEYRPEVLEK